ncbi:MAG: 16S rRNA (guanine(527)-N(7))-methyltransferase RsmG [Acidobacteriia bacterium]|nr:16S rRNA (guanine(527)-N(7))-methyltransferase RsmG [Terriglobia bacterium]
MDTARIAALLTPFVIPPLPLSQLDQISTYIDLLLRWNARINLTAIRHEEEIVTRHFGESLFMARHLFKADPADPEGAPPKLSLGGGFRVLDIGSGAGFPAVPLKIWAPDIHLTLIESNHKKAAFLREVARALTLTNINVITDRAETLAARPDFPRTEIVTLRAVEHFEAILPQAAALVAPKGRLSLLIGASQISSLTTLTGVKWNPPIPIPQSHARVLSIGVRE